ncbi:hypothetical protein B0H14DRAFT_2592609 [Mycena olivaceomarginata]|nr:hypothetical protein B0H14DRAFT_2592609 [Mycena olivaceomarginata]
MEITVTVSQQAKIENMTSAWSSEKVGAETMQFMAGQFLALITKAIGKGEDGSDLPFPDTLAPPRASARSRPLVKSVDSGARDAPTAGKRLQRVPACNDKDNEPESDFAASIPLPVRPTRSRHYPPR